MKNYFYLGKRQDILEKLKSEKSSINKENKVKNSPFDYDLKIEKNDDVWINIQSIINMFHLEQTFFEKDKNLDILNLVKNELGFFPIKRM